MRNFAPGFTLIELLVTLAIMGVLASAALPVAQVVQQRRQEQQLRSALNEIRHAIDDYKRAVDEGRVAKSAASYPYPKSLQVLVDGVPDMKSPKRSKLYFLRRIPRDPFAADSGLSDADTWGKRCYASEAAEPKEGDDVYDVYSTSGRLGLNGIAYAKW